MRREPSALSATRLIDNAVEISFAQANLGSQMCRLRARCRRNRPLLRRDRANLLPLGMKAVPSFSLFSLSSFSFIISPFTFFSLSCSVPVIVYSRVSFLFNLPVLAYCRVKAKRLELKHGNIQLNFLLLFIAFNTLLFFLILQFFFMHYLGNERISETTK